MNGLQAGANAFVMEVRHSMLCVGREENDR